MFVPGRVEKLSDDAVRQIDDLIDHRGCPLDGQHHQRGILPPTLEFTEILRGHLASFTGHPEQTVLVNPTFQAFRKSQRLKFPQTFDVLHHMPRFGFHGQLPQPRQPGDARSRLQRHPLIKFGALGR